MIIKGNNQGNPVQIREDGRGDIQVEIVPIKCGPLPEHIDVCFRDNNRTDQRHLSLVEMGHEASPIWTDLKEALNIEFGRPVQEQVLSPLVERNHLLPINDEARISDCYFRHGFVLRARRNPQDVAAPSRRLFGANIYCRVAGMPPYNSITSKSTPFSPSIPRLADGKINQTIYRDNDPPYLWDKDAAILFHIYTLDTAIFAEVTGNRHQRCPSAREPTRSVSSPLTLVLMGIRGNFVKMKSIAAIEEQRAKEEGILYQEEENVLQIVSVIGRYKSTFNPVDVLY
ncbi:hypothetical protein FHL15_007251 [Xylaria flabelliformis]|uniref:Uncharacterized protein n=1 Tax=Xylaria flabelliformis TaxID=2512241 RepID=A0A553HVF9_9PEZI|nr:hypothetical protein FHL15_007251 [Xylaria flabelliformis]